MDQPQDKFAQLSPVLELVYVMLTNMAKYMEVYSKDIDAQDVAQYIEARDAVNGAIKKFDALYGLKSPASSDEGEVATKPVEGQPYDFAAGSDPESLKKAKQAVEELKTLFGDMKKEEAANVQTPVTSMEQQPVAEAAVPQSAPTFMAAESVSPSQDMSAGTPAAVEPVAPVVSAPVEQPTTELPTPTNTPSPTQDAGEIDSILAELKKLQNKGTTQL